MTDPAKRQPLPKAHSNWYGYMHNGCGTQLSSDQICDRPATHATNPDPTLHNHRAHDPSGTGQWEEFDDYGNILGRGGPGWEDEARQSAAAAARALAEPDKVASRVAASRSTGVGALLPPVTPVATPPEPRGAPAAVTPPSGPGPADFAAYAARQRVRLYLLASDAFHGREMLDVDVIDTADGGSTGASLLLSDLRLLAGVEVYEDAEGFPASRPIGGW